jgi:hypothetical protein
MVCAMMTTRIQIADDDDDEISCLIYIYIEIRLSAFVVTMATRLADRV